MTPKLDLYDLIHSMTASEQNSFRKEIQKRKGRHLYLQVFEAILEQEEYDEAALKERFKGEKTLNNFSIAKSNLYEKVLEVLTALPHYQNLETRFDKLRSQISILLKKSLYRQALQRVRKTIRLAEKLESFRTLQDLYQLHREIARSFLPPRDYVDLHNEIRQKESWLREVNSNLLRYKELFETATIAPYFRREVRNAMINSILRHSLMQDESECRSIRSRIYFYRTWNYLYAVQKKASGWQFFSGKIIEILKEEKHLLADPGMFLVFVNTLYDFAFKCIIIGDYDDARTSAIELFEMRKTLKTGENEALIFSRYWKLQLIMAQRLLQTETGDQAIKEVRNGFRRYKDKLSKQDMMELEYLISVYLLTIERPSDSIRWILRLREERVSSNRPDLHYYSWLLFLIAHFNLGHFDVVEQQTPGTENYLRERKALGPLEKRALKFFKKVVRAKDMGETRSIMEGFYGDLETLLSNERYASFSEYFDMKAWLRSRIRGVPMSTQIAENASGENGKDSSMAGAGPEFL